MPKFGLVTFLKSLMLSTVLIWAIPGFHLANSIAYELLITFPADFSAYLTNLVYDLFYENSPLTHLLSETPLNILGLFIIFNIFLVFWIILAFAVYFLFVMAIIPFYVIFSVIYLVGTSVGRIVGFYMSMGIFNWTWGALFAFIFTVNLMAGEIE